MTVAHTHATHAHHPWLIHGMPYPDNHECHNRSYAYTLVHGVLRNRLRSATQACYIFNSFKYVPCVNWYLNCLFSPPKSKKRCEFTPHLRCIHIQLCSIIYYWFREGSRRGVRPAGGARRFTAYPGTAFPQKMVPAHFPEGPSAGLLHAHFEAPAAPVRTEPEKAEWAKRLPTSTITW